MNHLTPGDIAKRLDVHPWTVRRWIALGHLGAYRVGGRLRVTEDEYFRFKREGLHAAQSTNGHAVTRIEASA